MQAAQAAIAQAVTAAAVVCSDETSVRVRGKNWWNGRLPAPSRCCMSSAPAAARLWHTVFGAIKPAVWVPDRFGAQRGHGQEWQVCLAHLLRDARYAIACGNTAFSLPFKWLLVRAAAIGRRRERLDDDALKRYAADLRRRLNRLLAVSPIGEPGRRLHKRMARNSDHLFVCVTNRAVPYTNNVSARCLRPSAIFRKVTHGFRCEWRADTDAALRSVASTAKANQTTILHALQAALRTNAQVSPA